MQAQKRNFAALGEGADYLLPTTTRSSAAFVFTEAPITKTLSLQTGARLEYVSAQGTPASDEQTSRHFTPISGSAGLVFDASDVLRLGLTLSSAARAPAQTELFARGPHDGPATFETGDPTLSVERANSLEGSLRWHLSKITVDASLWGAKFNHYIYGRLTGRTCDDDGVCVADDSRELKELDYTQTGANFWGSEAKSTISLYTHAKGTLKAEMLADYVRAKTDDGENLPRITPYHVGAGLSWEGKAIDGGVFWKYTGRRGENDIAPAETPTAGFVSVDAHLGWRLLPSNPDMEIALVGHNLTDTVQRNAIALNKDAVILPGRDVRLVATAKF
jgi:iron complex outermembrane receptor protein